MSEKLNTAVAVMGIDIGKNSFHVIGLDARGAIALRQKWSGTRGQVETRLANMPPCLIGIEKPALVHIIWAVGSRRLVTMPGSCRRNTCGRTARDKRMTSATAKRSPRRCSARR